MTYTRNTQGVDESTLSNTQAHVHKYTHRTIEAARQEKPSRPSSPTFTFDMYQH